MHLPEEQEGSTTPMLINYHFGIALVTNLLLLTAVSLLRVALLRIAALLRISTLLGISTLPTLLSCDTDIGQHSLVLIILHTTRQRPCLAPTGDLHPLLTCRSVVSGLNTKVAGIVGAAAASGFTKRGGADCGTRSNGMIYNIGYS